MSCDLIYSSRKQSGHVVRLEILTVDGRWSGQKPGWSVFGGQDFFLFFLRDQVVAVIRKLIATVKE